ncbi:MAG: hypothetical protein L3J44_10005 [Campylobacteraceae bacterium]|nr:hypothetical protein [Campylobacteraceae bacterium]
MMHKEEAMQSVKLNRSSIQIKENEYVEYKGEVYKISSIIDFNEVVGIDIKTKRAKRLRIWNVPYKLDSY